MGFLKRATTKKGFVLGTVAVGLVASAFGYLLRDCINFGKMEGDTRPAKVAKAEKRIFSEALVKLKDVEIPEGDVFNIKELFEKL